ncbi:universal stress protein [Subtercola frigoramans]|uniref:Nucleotide-binding universal stress UspA family protein n=1 Tax=Subtercola frigoramans TaxID=120298 RepID=A0ABS2L3Q4_9MICO|nr:universal stress protein [Subtercola frigoramans]MBM7471654.1 nucleotide-binding universal stress UspA family protein [Subtercola frigoramans]
MPTQEPSPQLSPPEVGEPAHRPLFVVGVDGSPSSVKALRHAVTLGQFQNALVRAVTVWSYPNSYTPLPTTWSPEDDAREILAEVTASVFGDSVPEWFEQKTHEGTPARVLIDESANADMIVVGSRGHGGFAGLLLGSVSSQCAEHAGCPVLVVHGTDTV